MDLLAPAAGDRSDHPGDPGDGSSLGDVDVRGRRSAVLRGRHRLDDEPDVPEGLGRRPEHRSAAVQRGNLGLPDPGCRRQKVAFAANPDAGKVTIVGTGNYKKLRSTDPALSFTVCHYSTPAPQYDPALTYTVIQGPVTGNPWNACVTTSVSVTGTPLFYAGWRADVEMSAAVALANTPPNTYQRVYASGGAYTLQQLPGNVWRVSGSHWGNYGIRDGQGITFTLCAE